MNRAVSFEPVLGSVPLMRLLLALAIGVSFFLGLGAVPLFDLDEGAFTEATREMLLRRDFISTWLNGVPRFDKPILIYWLQAASVSLFGQSEWAFRLPSALCATLWVLTVYAFIRKVRGEAAGLMAGAITATAAGILRRHRPAGTARRAGRAEGRRGAAGADGARAGEGGGRSRRACHHPARAGRDVM